MLAFSIQAASLGPHRHLSTTPPRVPIPFLPVSFWTANMSEKEKGWPYVVGDENSNELHTQDDPENLPESGSQERIAAEHRLVRKLDTRLLPTIFLIYILNHIDVCSLSFDNGWPRRNHSCRRLQTA